MKKIFFLFLIFVSTALSAFPPSVAAPTESEWTFLDYLNGDNNLDPYGEKDIKEMLSVGSSEKVQILVLHDTSDINTNTKIYHINYGSKKTVKDFGHNIDMVIGVRW